MAHSFLQNQPAVGAFPRQGHIVDATRWDRSIPSAGLAQPDAATPVHAQPGTNVVIPLSNLTERAERPEGDLERLTNDFSLDNHSLDSVSMISESNENRYANRYRDVVNPETLAYNR